MSERTKDGQLISTEQGDRWFRILQDRKREHAARVRKAKARERTVAERARDHASQGQHIKMEHTEWTYDEHGNLSRTIYSTGKE